MRVCGRRRRHGGKNGCCRSRAMTIMMIMIMMMAMPSSKFIGIAAFGFESFYIPLLVWANSKQASASNGTIKRKHLDTSLSLRELWRFSGGYCMFPARSSYVIRVATRTRRDRRFYNCTYLRRCTKTHLDASITQRNPHCTATMIVGRNVGSKAKSPRATMFVGIGSNSSTKLSRMRGRFQREGCGSQRFKRCDPVVRF